MHKINTGLMPQLDLTRAGLERGPFFRNPNLEDVPRSAQSTKSPYSVNLLPPRTPSSAVISSPASSSYSLSSQGNSITGVDSVSKSTSMRDFFSRSKESLTFRSTKGVQDDGESFFDDMFDRKAAFQKTSTKPATSSSSLLPSPSPPTKRTNASSSDNDMEEENGDERCDEPFPGGPTIVFTFSDGTWDRLKRSATAKYCHQKVPQDVSSEGGFDAYDTSIRSLESLESFSVPSTPASTPVKEGSINRNGIKEAVQKFNMKKPKHDPDASFLMM
ncbi:hypothetical protein NLJ89_g2247 [Agrocybe chaxingu]|uniref:Uncharacterized protein n=1 Tax=Agrocybe chaxingu TaxID=84603 RepID=A0A9W8KCG6_9AGAR|nr:hypothetical protein NLJ89_g2247 [Agrocybe chaxingu]